MLTQARYLSSDLQATKRFGKGPSVVLVHGLYATAGVWRPLRQRLERELDASTFSFSYPPGPGIEELSLRLVSLVRTIASPAPLVLMGHSLGGLVIRHYLCQGSIDPRIVLSVSLAAPFRGSTKHHLVPGQAGRDIRSGSPILERLRSENGGRFPHVTLIASDDELIEKGAIPEFGSSEVFERVGHNGMLFDERVVSRCVRIVQDAAGTSMSDRCE